MSSPLSLRTCKIARHGFVDVDVRRTFFSTMQATWSPNHCPFGPDIINLISAISYTRKLTTTVSVLVEECLKKVDISCVESDLQKSFLSESFVAVMMQSSKSLNKKKLGTLF